MRVKRRVVTAYQPPGLTNLDLCHVKWYLVHLNQSLMSMNGEERKPICILSLDSGGPGTYSQLLILKEMMSRLANDLGVNEDDVYPADHFDLMGGVGFGGFLAIVLGHLRMNVSQAIAALVSLASMIFPETSNKFVDREENLDVLKQVVESTLHARSIALETKMKDTLRLATKCKVVLYAATSDNMKHAQAFRTYPSRGPSLNPTIVEAVGATMAIPSHFMPVKIGSRPDHKSFVGGPLGSNNPSRELLKEASVIFGNERRVAQIVSIGCGVPPVLSLQAITSETGAGRLLKEIPDECEMVAKELAARLYDVDAYLRLSVERGMANIEMDQWGMLGDIEMHTTCYIETQMIVQVMEALLKRLQRRPGAVTLGHLNHSSSIKVAAKKAPSVSPHFVLRDKEWRKLVWHLVTSPASRQRILPITGMGGCGKTQLVSYFLQEYPNLFKHSVYVDASTLSSIEGDLEAWVRTREGGHERDTWEDAIRILASIPEDERWGLILDNEDDPTLNLVPVIPKSKNLTVIITSRNPNLGNLSTTCHIEMGEMEPEEALSTLLHAARRQLPLAAEELKSAHIILKELGCLAVALVQAGTYCHELSCSFTRYLALFYSHRAELMKTAEPFSLDNYQRGAYTTLDLSYKALPQPSRDFLHFISFFHHTDIPLSALAAATRVDFEDVFHYFPRPDTYERVRTGLRRILCTKGYWDERQVQNTLRTLRSFSLLSISSIDDSIFLQLHPLIQSWSRDMDPSSSQHHQAMALRVLTVCGRDDAFLLHRYLLPHILNMLDQLKSQDIHINDLMAAGLILYRQGRYRAAAELFETALDTMENSTENNVESIMKISGWLSRAYRDQGRWNDAERLQVAVLEQRRRVQGMEHPATLTAAAYLVLTYGIQDRWTEAEKLGVEVLEQCRRVPGMEHPEAATVTGYLAAAYRARGRWHDAEKLEVEVLEQHRSLHGVNHPLTIIAAANLAATYYAQGRWIEAENLQVEVLEKHRRVFGMEHAGTATVAASLAATYYSQGLWNKAEKLQIEVLEQSRKTLVMEHPYTIIAAGNLATTYQAQGRWRDAEKLQVDVLERCRRVLGIEHPRTITTAGNLAAAYGQQGRWEEDASLLAPIVQLSLKILGQQHPNTQMDIRSLVFVYEKLGKEKEAQETRDLLIS